MGNGIKGRLRAILFILSIVGTVAQTTLTFYLLYNQSTSELFHQVVVVLLLTFLLAFLVIVAMSFHAKKISHEAMRGYKRTQKAVKRILTLLMLVLSVVNIINARGSGLEFTLAIIMIIYNLIIIYIDMKITNFTDKIARKRKQKEREKREEELRAYRVGDKRRKKEQKNEE